MNPWLCDETARPLLGPLTLIAASEGLPVTRDEVKEHTSVFIDDDDRLIDRKIAAAVEYCQEERGWQILQATFDVAIRCWWNYDRPLRLPRSPLASVSSLKYYDTTETLITVDPSYYQVHTPFKAAGQIELLRTFYPAALSCRAFPIVARIVTGYPSRDAVPSTVKEAIYQMAEHLYVNRGSTGADLPPSVTSLLDATHPQGYA